MIPLRDRFTALVLDGRSPDLARAALAIACIGHPDLDPEPSLERLDRLADAIRPRLGARTPPDDAARVITGYLFGEGGFHGNADDYYDPRNSFLNDVLTRRTGIPISLAIVLLEVGRRLRVPLEGVGFPGHFLVRAPARDGFLVLDPFLGRPIAETELLERLRSLATDGPHFEHVPPPFLAPTPPPAILARMLRNLLRLYRDRDEPAHALTAVDLMLVLAPDAPDELRVRAELYERLECWASAAADLRRLLALAPGTAEAVPIRAQLARLARLAPPTH